MNMEDFIPEKNYHPEDEYESLESAADSPAFAKNAEETAKEPEPASIPLRPGPEQQPAPQPMQTPEPAQPLRQSVQPQPAQPPVQQPYYSAYRQPEAYTQPIRQPIQQPVQQPVQYGYPAQLTSPGYPQGYPQPGQVSAPAQPQQIPVTAQTPYPVQQQVPVQQVPTQQQAYVQPPVRNTIPLSPNPYAQGYNRQQPAYTQPKPPTPTGTKVFIIILCALLAAMVLGFVFYIAGTQRDKSKPEKPSGNSYSIGGDNDGSDSDPSPNNGFYFNNKNASFTDVEDEITLKADNGDTQKRDDDNPESVGEPDEKAENIVLQPLPKDKDDDKYTTQSAYDTVSDSVVTVVCYDEKITEDTNDIKAQGTGTIISSDGYLVTNAHVLNNSRAYAVNIVLNNGDKYQAKIVGYDTWTDLAVLKIDAKDLKAVSFGDSSLINVGDDVIAIGSPGGEKFQNSLTKGIVSAVGRELSVNKYVRYIQSDAAISPGSSGGPLCNIYGQVIGITTAKTVAEYYENMSFSIPSSTVEEIVGDLMRYGYVKGRARIGFSGTEISADEVYYYGYPQGVVIGEIDSEGALAGTEIKENDIVVELDGKEITSFQDIYDVLADHKPDDKISIKVKRPSN